MLGWMDICYENHNYYSVKRFYTSSASTGKVWLLWIVLCYLQHRSKVTWHSTLKTRYFQVSSDCQVTFERCCMALNKPSSHDLPLGLWGWFGNSASGYIPPVSQDYHSHFISHVMHFSDLNKGSNIIHIIQAVHCFSFIAEEGNKTCEKQYYDRTSKVVDLFIECWRLTMTTSIGQTAKKNLQ